MHNILPQVKRDAPCALCGQADFRLLAKQDRRGVKLDTVICRVCGLVAHARLPSEVELAEYYRRQYRLEYQGDFVPSPHRVVREWNRGQRLLQLLQPFLDTRDKIVEIGCGIGCTVGSFQRAGFLATGVEPSDGFRRFGVDRLGISVRGGVLSDLHRRPTADMILLVHVLEHLRSPGDALAHIRSLLRCGGKCYIEVPNAGAPHAAPGKMFHQAHIYNFTPDTLSMLAAKNKFAIVKWLSGPRDKNLRVVLQGRESAAWAVAPGSYERAVQAMAGFSRLRYYLRWSYVRQRLLTLVGHPSDRVLAARRVAAILQPDGFQHRDDAFLRPLASRTVAWRKS